jgi:ribulose 1,5-bisphosphate carboxylase large subunit-like protein
VQLNYILVELDTMDQSNRYADLSLDETELMVGKNHIFAAYTMQPVASFGYLEIAAHVAAESSTGTNVTVRATDVFTRDMDAIVYEIDEAQGNQVFCPINKVIPLLVDSMKRAQDETGKEKLFFANITADDYHEMCYRADFILESFGEFAPHVAFLVDGYVGGPGMVTTVRCHYPSQYLHYHRASHGAVTWPSFKRGYTALF